MEGQQSQQTLAPAQSIASCQHTNAASRSFLYEIRTSLKIKVMKDLPRAITVLGQCIPPRLSIHPTVLPIQEGGQDETETVATWIHVRFFPGWEFPTCQKRPTDWCFKFSSDQLAAKVPLDQLWKLIRNASMLKPPISGRDFALKAYYSISCLRVTELSHTARYAPVVFVYTGRGYTRLSRR